MLSIFLIKWNLSIPDPTEATVQLVNFQLNNLYQIQADHMLSFCVNRPPQNTFFFLHIGKTSLIWFHGQRSFFHTPHLLSRQAFWFLKNKAQDYIKYSILHVACTWWWWFSLSCINSWQSHGYGTVGLLLSMGFSEAE